MNVEHKERKHYCVCVCIPVFQQGLYEGVSGGDIHLPVAFISNIVIYRNKLKKVEMFRRHAESLIEKRK